MTPPNANPNVVAVDQIGTVAIEVVKNPSSFLLHARDPYGITTSWVCRSEPRQREMLSVADWHVRLSQAKTRRN